MNDKTRALSSRACNSLKRNIYVAVKGLIIQILVSELQ